jgi:hypothetical protein
MDNFKERFDKFCTEICEESRFFFSEKTHEFLEELYSFIIDPQSKGNSIKTIPQGSCFYRARTHGFRNETNDYDEQPFDIENMKPIANIRANGRLNAYNVNALYLAYDQNTAISEARADSNAPISVVKLKTNRNLTIATFDYFSDVHGFYDYFFPGPAYYLAHRFSQPLDHPENQSREYIPTQVIAEFLRKKGIDGIEYPSQFITLDQQEIIVQQGESNKRVSSSECQQISDIEKELSGENIKYNLCLFDIHSADCLPNSIEVWKLTKRVNIVRRQQTRRIS